MDSKPVTNWTTDYDILDPDYVADVVNFPSDHEHHHET